MNHTISFAFGLVRQACESTRLDNVCLQDCSGTDKLMGQAPMWLSVIIILIIGFVAGVLVGVFATQYRQRRWMQRSIGGPDPSVYDSSQVAYNFCFGIWHVWH